MASGNPNILATQKIGVTVMKARGLAKTALIEKHQAEYDAEVEKQMNDMGYEMQEIVIVKKKWVSNGSK